MSAVCALQPAVGAPCWKKPAGTAGRRQRCAAASTAEAVCRPTSRHNPLRQGLDEQQQQQQRSPQARARQAGCRVLALDAAFPFDREAQLRQQHSQQNKLKVGIVGFGTFGQFLAKRLVQAGHEVIATSRSPYHDVAARLSVKYFTDADDFCEEHPEVVILATSILSLEQVLAALPVQRLKRSTLFVDVLSVKEFPKRLLLRQLPPEVDILCTHPMFGPDSGKGSWAGLNMQYERVRIASDSERQRRCDAFLQFFEREGCNMVEMSCEEHDQLAASTQFITHTVGRMLGAMQLQATPIDTKGFQSLLSLVDNTANDSFDLYYGLFMYNQNSTEQLDRLEKAFDEVKARLLQQLHDKVRQQIFHGESYQPDQQQQRLMLTDRTSSSAAAVTAAATPGAGQQQVQEASSGGSRAVTAPAAATAAASSSNGASKGSGKSSNGAAEPAQAAPSS